MSIAGSEVDECCLQTVLKAMCVTYSGCCLLLGSEYHYLI